MLGESIMTARSIVIGQVVDSVKVDRATAGEILGLLDRLNRELGKTVLMVTHDPKAAEAAHRIIHLEKGVLVD